SGWYVTDYAKKSAASAGSPSSSEGDGATKEAKDSKDTKDAKDTKDTKKDEKPKSESSQKKYKKEEPLLVHILSCGARPSGLRQSVLASRQQRSAGGAVHRQIFP